MERISLWVSVIYITILMVGFAKNRMPHIVTRLGVTKLAEEDVQTLSFAILFTVGYPLYIYALMH